MDKHNENNGQPDEIRSLISSSINNIESNGASGDDETVPVSKIVTRQVRPVMRPAVDGVSTPAKMDAHQVALQRARLNRHLRRKRWHQRNLRADRTAPRILTSVLIAFAVVLVILSGTAAGAFAYYQAQLPLLSGLANHTSFQTTHIYDRNGNLLYQLSDPKYGRRTYVNYSDISQDLVHATVAAEDHTFWNNNGFDLQGILRAAFSNVQSQTVVEGGSTITQQLIKNELFLSQPRTPQVKAEEILLAYGITQQLPKWKIMEMYLNTVYYGDLNYGIEAAAQDFFNLHPKCTRSQCIPAVAQLDLAQASLLAGLPQSPSYYNPVINKPAALHRQHIVLDSMVQLGMITPAQQLKAEHEMAKFNFKSYTSDSAIQAPHFVHYVIDQVLVPMLGAQNLEDGGYNIYTTIDLNLERKVDQLAYDHLYKVECDNYLGCTGPLNVQNNVNNAAVVVMAPSNGEILAMDGSVNYTDKNPEVDGQVNVALSLRQPGSSFKPIVYATDFEMGWYPAMILPDHKTIYPTLMPDGTYYTPKNYDGTFHTGFPMTVRNAVANSFNIPALDGIEFAGVSNVQNMAGRLGLSEIASLPASQTGPSMALGANRVSLLHLTGAYATFANGGVRVPPTSILEITDSQGHPLYTYDAAHPHGIRAMSAGVAFLISSILSDKTARYHEFFRGNPLELDRPAAAKTGTTGNAAVLDNWTMGYTPHLAVGVWVGNNNNSPLQNVIGITGAGPLWHDVMEYVSNYYHFPADDFMRPADVHEGTVSAYSGLLPHAGEPSVTDWFIDGTMPTIQGPSFVPFCRGDGCGGNRGGGGNGGGNGGFGGGGGNGGNGFGN